MIGDRPPLRGLAPLLRLACQGTAQLVPVQTELFDRVANGQLDAHTLLDLSIVLQFMRQRDLAMTAQAEALTRQQIYTIAPAQAAALRLLVIKGRGDLMANTPVECLLEHGDVRLTLVYVGANLPLPAMLPEHDVVFVAVGESDENRPLLRELMTRLRGWPRPVINLPDAILRVSREHASHALAGVPGAVMPAVRRVDRDGLRAIDGPFPILVRPIGSHAGQGLVKIDAPSAVAPYLEERTASEFYVTPFVDYSSADGQFRKYRLALIDGRPFVCHVAISSHWMVHYLNAGMAESVQKRAEESHLMATFDCDFARRHAAALAEIDARIGLEYLGIDCAETQDGRLLVFEIDSAMIVHDMDPVDLFPYKASQMLKVFAAFRAMLGRVSAAGATNARRSA